MGVDKPHWEEKAMCVNSVFDARLYSTRIAHNHEGSALNMIHKFFSAGKIG
ncbi:hypothetical protein CULCOIPH005_07520 [Corynebacterium ulcerans]|uniref:Uncharacterized protein n=1 Tax=Corynebacterium ulcerans TaxID=65058 RepID=A0ABD0BFK3_CORUL|nr:hypothetical protein CULCOIPH005_07520 [Corynebacterium ulcerans]